jgi:glutathione S-transferase
MCPFSRLVRIYLHEKILEYDSIQEFPWRRKKSFSENHVFSDIPTLVEKDGQLLEGWYAIVEYIEQIYKTKPMFGISHREKSETRRIVALFNGMFFADVTKNIFFERVVKRYTGDAPDSSCIRKSIAGIKAYMEHISWLADRRNWLAGDELTLADVAAAAHISCLDYFGSVEWENFPVAKDWYTRIKSRPSFRDILHDRIQIVPPVSYYQELDF